MEAASFPDEAHSPTDDMSISELQSEIQFQAVLLQSIDDSVPNRDDAEKEVVAEIKRLKLHLQKRKGEVPTSSPQANVTTNGRPANMNSAIGIDPFARSSYHFGDPFATNSSTASTPNSGASQYADLDSNHIDLPTRKRTHSKVAPGVLSPGFHKSQRTSPSPYDNGQATPSTGDDDIDPGFIEQQKQAEERIKREKMDAEYAMSVSQAFTPQDNASFSTNRTHGGFSAFDRMSGARPQPSSSLGVSSARKPIPSFGESSRLTNGVKREDNNSSQMGFSSYAPPKGSATFGSTPNSRASYANGTGIKSESSASRQMPGSYRDDSSTSGDSDIEFISSTAFHDNGRFSSRPGSSSSVYGSTQANQYGHGYSPESHNASGSGLQRMNGPASNSALHMAMYGKGSVAPWMKKEGASSQQPGSMMSTPPYNPYATQQGVGPSGYPPGVYDGMIQHPGIGSGSMNGMHQSASYGSSYGPGLGYQINDLSSPAIGNEYDMDFTQTGMGQLDSLSSIIRRANNGNFDELGEYLKLDSSRYSQLDYIMSDPRKTEQEIKDLLENIRPDSDLPPEDRAGTPEGLKYPLYEHQKLALTWMKSMEEGTNKGGILADDMGLGKTISTLALLLTRPSEDRLRKTTLIVGPVALIRQWVRELQQKINVAHKLSVQMVHGSSGKKMSWDDLRNFDVVLTTYGTLGAEYRRWEKYVHQLKIDNVREADGNACKKTYPFFGPKSAWYRVILDEAQCIKNKNTQNAKAACNLKSLTRFCLTGTPMMNGVGELYSLIHFLRIKPYNDYSRFTRDFGKLSKGKSNHHETENAMRKLQTVLKAILLRRTKTSLIDGKPIITLPPKTEEIQHVVFSEDEQGFYTALEQKSQLQFNKYMKAGTVMKNYANVLVLLLRLRQCCCHPHLIQDFEKAQPAVGSLDADVMIELAKSLAPDVVGRLLAAEAFECPVCYDAVDNPSIVIPCGHDTCSECLSKISDTADQNNIANGEEGAATKCPTCRGKVDINKIIDYTTFKKVYKPDPIADDEEADEGNGLSDDESSGSESGSDTESESDMDEAGNLKGFIVRDDEEESDEGETEDDDDDDLSEPKEKPKAKKNSRKDKRQRRKGKGKAKEPSKHKSLAMLKAEASKSIAGRKKYMKALKKNWESSAKVDKCVDLLRKFQADGQKTIIFSQFVSLLDLLSIPIEQEGWNCERYDGSMNANARHQACVDFTDKPDVKIMLISLKAGNAGLNLVAASRVIILDPFWNPYIEMQAVDRAHRIGQQREVEVHRILIQNTVEDRIIELQERKKALINAALDEGSQESIGRLDARQLAFLFGVGRM